MRIEVLGEDSISAWRAPTRKYRLFAALSRIVDTDRVTRARLVLRRATPSTSPASDAVSCTVSVDVEE